MEVPSPVGNSNDYSRAGFDLHVSLSKYQKSKAIVNCVLIRLILFHMFMVIYRPCIGSRTKRRTMSWMLLTMHSNISGYVWLGYYALTYTMCWNSYAPQDGKVNWNYFQLSFLGSLRIGK